MLSRRSKPVVSGESHVILFKILAIENLWGQTMRLFTGLLCVSLSVPWPSSKTWTSVLRVVLQTPLCSPPIRTPLPRFTQCLDHARVSLLSLPPVWMESSLCGTASPWSPRLLASSFERKCSN